MLTSRKQSPLISSCSYNANALSLVLTSGLKRQYKSDLKPFNDIFTMKNLTLTVVKAAIIPMNNIVNEYNIYAIAQSQKEETEDIDEFDWNASIDNNKALFLPNLFRVASITVIKKSLEEYASLHLSDKLADRLTKDVYQSILRKCERFPRLVACPKIFVTAFWGNMLFNLSCIVYDTGMRLYEELNDSVSATRPVRERVFALVKFVGKRMIYYSICLTSCAVGQALGSFFNVQNGGMVGGFVFELVGGLVCAQMIGM